MVVTNEKEFANLIDHLKVALTEFRIIPFDIAVVFFF